MTMKKRKINIENIEEKFNAITSSLQWRTLSDAFKKAKDVYLIGNGGLDTSHLAIDMSKLLTKAKVEKYIHTPCNVIMVTGIANDEGFNNLYSKWLETYQKRVGKDSLVIGMSCSGRSKNILTALFYANKKKAQSCLISGVKADSLPIGIKEVCMNTETFHVSETLSMLLLYQLIHEAGGECPKIRSEIERKSISSHISRANDK